MDFPIFQEDSYFNDINRSINWSKDSMPIDLIQVDKLQDKKNSIHCLESVESHSCQSESHESQKNHQQSTQTSIPEVQDEKFEKQKVFTLTNTQDSKSKKIYKPKKHDQKLTFQNNKFSANLSPPECPSNRSKSKYNNMGGYLIGTFSEILNIQKSYRLNNGWLQTEVKGNWTTLEKVEFFDVFKVERWLVLLKEKIYNLPRKDGAKKHLFDLINSEPSEPEELKKSKSILRKELILGLDRQYWLSEHVQSRDFKPQNDDFFGTKKQQRHQAYMQYLQAIKFALQTKECIPKRIRMSWE